MAAVILRVCVGLSALIFVLAIPEQGKWIVNLDQNNQFVGVAKHMYKDSRVTVTVSLKCGEHTDGVDISWLLRMSPCAMEFISAADDIKGLGNDAKKQINMENYMKMPLTQKSGLPYDKVEWVNGYYSHNCSEQEFKLESDPNQKPEVYTIPKPPKNVTGDKPVESSDSKSAAQGSSKTASSEGKKTDEKAPPASSDKEKASDKKETPADESGKQQSSADDSAKKDNSAEKKVASNSSSRKKRDESQQKAGADAKKPGAPAAPAVTKGPTAPHNPDKLDHPDVATVWRDGNYLFVLRLRPKGKDASFKAEVTIRTFYGDENYISAMDYPLLIFYGVMGLVYIVYGLVWLVLLACNWRDLLRVQFWIGGVILLGMLEKAVFFAEYENINKTGQSVRGAVIFAELMSCLKRTLARMLVIIVSLGFGIVKPRLGQAFHKVLFVGGLYFILASIEGCMRATIPKADQSNQFLLAGVPLAVLEAIICWWIFSSLIQTTRTLRLRRNVVKLTLYRHFTNTLIFAVLASVACMVWAMTQHKFKECIKDWKQLWIDEAFWHMLFVILLFIIMLLWRPTANNQRYAFSPLLDAADEEDDEDAMMNDAFDGMKMRGVKASNGSPKPKDPKSKVEDDLKWVEENIPSSVADKALPTLLDSDEELMTTKFEMSKME